MRPFVRAFTLVELLVVVAVLALLSAILFPVFATAKGSAERASCMSNLRSLTAGTALYLGDYDDRLMPVNYDLGRTSNSRTDRTWVQNLLPYVGSFAVFHCPADPTNPGLFSTFDQDLVPGDTDSQYYTASLHSDYGYNFQNLAPIVFDLGQWIAEPKDASAVASLSTTLLFADSVWAQTESGNPTGGGNWLVTPPCRYYAGPGHVDSFTGASDTNRIPVYTPTVGWSTRITAHPEDDTPGEPGEWFPLSMYGNVWPRHFSHMNVAMLDGSVHSLTPAQLTAGCDVKDAWRGLIFDRLAYLWDVQ